VIANALLVVLQLAAVLSDARSWWIRIRLRLSTSGSDNTVRVTIAVLGSVKRL
jgi:hypothetical protein